MRKLTDVLIDGRHSLVVETAWGELRVYDGRGVEDVYGLYVSDCVPLKNARVADKVVGAGAAALMIAGGVKEYYAHVISRQALDLFKRYGVSGSYGTLADRIINRSGTGQCPLESLVSHLTDVESMLPLIDGFVSKTSNAGK